MSSDSRVAILVAMEGPMKAALVARVHANDSNLNDEAVSILAERLGLPFSPTGRRAHPSPRGGAVVLRMDKALKRRLQHRALESDRSNLAHTINSLLGEELNVKVAPAGRVRSPFGGGRR